MDRWREVAARVVAEESEGTAQVQPGGALPLSIAAGLAALSTMPQPRRLRVGCQWNEIKADAARLVAEGWTGNALALGWHPLELFGCGAKSSAGFEGLAVWLAGRRLVLLDERSAVAVDGRWRRIFNRPRGFDPSSGGAVFLWEFGRG